MQILDELTTKRSTPYLIEAKNDSKTSNRKNDEDKAREITLKDGMAMADVLIRHSGDGGLRWRTCQGTEQIPEGG